MHVIGLFFGFLSHAIRFHTPSNHTSSHFITLLRSSTVGHRDWLVGNGPIEISMVQFVQPWDGESMEERSRVYARRARAPLGRDEQPAGCPTAKPIDRGRLRSLRT